MQTPLFFFLILTSDDQDQASDCQIKQALENKCNEIEPMQADLDKLRIELLNKNKNTMIPHLVNGQLRLPDFGMVL